MKRTILMIAIALLLLAGCSQAPTGQAVKEEAIKIGYVGPLTGNQAGIGQAQLNAVKMAVEGLNAHGGINGTRVQLFIADDKHEPQESVTAVHALLDAHGVVAIVGPTNSAATMAVAPIVNEAHVPLISPVATSPVVREAGPYVFRTMPDTALETKKLAAYAHEQGFEKVAVIAVNNDFGKGSVDAFKGYYNGTVTSVHLHTAGTTDHRSELVKAMNDNPDAILIASYFIENGNIIKQARELGFEGELFGVETINQAECYNVAQESAEGVVYATPTPLATDEFKEAYAEKYGEEPRFSADTAYDAFMLLAEAIEECGTNGEAIRECLHRIGQDYAGASGTITFDENGDVDKPFSLYRVENGTGVLIG